MCVPRFLLLLLLILLLTAPNLGAQQSIFTTQTPQVQADTDNAAGEYGMIFTASVAGQVTGVRYWKSASDTGAHTGRLWRVSDRVLLATATFASGTTTGWQTQSFAAPVTITAGTQYLVTVSSPLYYGATTNGLNNVVTNGSLSTVVGANGLYGFTLGAYPTLSWNSSNYFRDVVFVPGSAPPPPPGTPAISITPETVTVNLGATQQFSPALSGGASGPVSWSATCGSINSSGLYTAPQTGTSCTVTGSATGANDTSLIALNQPPQPPAPGGLVLFEDFTQPWTVQDRGGDETAPEDQCYKPSQVSMNGQLVITAINQSAMCGSGMSPVKQWPYTSGQVQWTSRSFTYGTVEYRAKFPGGMGVWPAIWLLGKECQVYYSTFNDPPCNWPEPGADEIDITEDLSADSVGINQQIHSGNHNDGCWANVDSTQYHTYQLIWSAGSVIWKVDGVTTCTVTGSYVPSHPMFLIIQVAVGGAAGAVDASALPQSMYVDYVKVTQP